MSELKQHAETIRQLLQKDRNEVSKQNLEALLSGVRSGQLSEDDILQFTNISRKQLAALLERG